MLRHLWILMITLGTLFSFYTGYSADNEGIIRAKGNATPLTHGGFRLFHPKWSYDGKHIAMTSDNFRGIWVMDIKTFTIQPLSDEERTGYGFVWSSDSKEIACRITKSAKHKRLSAIKIYEIESGLSRLVTDFRQRIGLPSWADADGKICYTVDKKLEVVSSERKIRPASRPGADEKEVILFQSYGKIILSNLAQTSKTILVNPTNRFLNPQLSYDHQKIAFEMTDNRIYVMSIDGSEIYDLGIGSAPRWAPTSDYLVFFISEDDGQRITAADIYITDYKGQQKFALTNTQDRIEMHPDWSPDGQIIIYDEYETGIIYQIKLEKNNNHNRLK